MKKTFTLVLILLSLTSCEHVRTKTDSSSLELSAEQKGPSLSGSPELIYKVLLADIAAKRGRMDVAKREYTELAKRTRDPRLIEAATRSAFIARDNKLALENARLWVEVDPENLEARKLLSVLLIKMRRTEEAVRHLEKLVTDFWSDNLQGFLLIARMLGSEKDSRVAFKVMQNLVARYPDVAEAQYALAELALRAEDLAAADKAIVRVLELKPVWPEAIIFRTRVFQAQGKLNDAMEYLGRQVENIPDKLNLRLSYARLLLEAKRYTQARQQFKRLAELAPDNEDILYALGGLSLEVKQYADAENYLTQLIKMRKKTLVASYFLGQTKEQQKQFKEAIHWYSKVDRGEHYLSAQIRIAMIHAGQGNQGKARKHLDSIDANNTAQRVRLFIAHGEIYRASKEPKKEIEAYNRGLKEYSENTNLLYARALAAEKIGDLVAVEGDLRLILKNEPNNAAALNALGYTLADRTKRYKEALALIERAYELRPDDAAILDSMGWIYFRMGQYEKAEKYLRNAMADSDDPEIAAHLGEVLWVNGNEQAAKDVWVKARLAAPDNEVLLDVLQKFGQM